jgi:UDP-GlcNAc:undecaprenyl-phosphate/decaprenyl-phosphate GlcNAc-1-phosphate transferase
MSRRPSPRTTPAGGPLGTALLRSLVAGSGARLAYAALTSKPPGEEKTWTRTNHRGEPVTLLEGPAVSVAAAAAVVGLPGLDVTGRLAQAVAGVSAGAFGCYDDLVGSGDRRGFRGHLSALASGEVTTGAIKLIGVGAAGFAAAALLDRRPGPTSDGRLAGRMADLAINAGLIAGGANLLNLFDLRPGRAVKVSLLAGTALAVAAPDARALVAAPLGASAALLPEDLGERAMLGDAGANSVGAMLGVAAAASLPRPARLVALAGIVGLTAASEKISFTKVIARTPALNWLDMLGRRPASTPASSDPSQRPEGGAPLTGDAGAPVPAASAPPPA